MIENELQTDDAHLVETFGDITETLKERGSRYGPWDTNAVVAHNIKHAFEESRNWASLEAYQSEALDLIATKISRILNGDPNYLDSWHDIIGYVKLVEQELNASD